jgi:hypothetical protein
MRGVRPVAPGDRIVHRARVLGGGGHERTAATNVIGWG